MGVGIINLLQGLVSQSLLTGAPQLLLRKAVCLTFGKAKRNLCESRPRYRMLKDGPLKDVKNAFFSSWEFPHQF